MSVLYILLAATLAAMFPANIYAARSGHTIAGRPHTPLPLRTAIQVLFVAALWWAAAASLWLIGVVLAPRPMAAQETAARIAQAAWLRGCWESVTPERAIEEQWMAPRGGSMVMMGRTVHGVRLVDYELVVLREDGDQLAYEAHPAGQPSAVFRSTVLAPDRMVFENLGHDFPQRVGYQQTAPDGLTAWIEGTQNGKSRRIDFVYRRAQCSSQESVR